MRHCFDFDTSLLGDHSHFIADHRQLLFDQDSQELKGPFLIARIVSCTFLNEFMIHSFAIVLRIFGGHYTLVLA